jgi:hypothetical protein
VSDIVTLPHKWLTGLEVSHFTLEKYLDILKAGKNSLYWAELKAVRSAQLLVKDEWLISSTNVAKSASYDASSIESA